MYGKIFDSMYEGTLYGHWQAIVTLQQMIVLSDASGTVDMTPQAMSARTSIPLKIILKGIEDLSAPDPQSRTPGEDGRRIVLIDEHRPWGWVLVNHDKYQKLKSMEEKREADRIRIAEKRKNNKNNDVADVSQPVADVVNVAHADADADADADANLKSKAFTPQAALRDVDPKIVSDWLKVRKEKKAATTETAIAGVRREAEKAGLTMQEAVKLCCENSWAGFKASWDWKGKGNGGVPDYSEVMARIKD